MDALLIETKSFFKKDSKWSTAGSDKIEIVLGSDTFANCVFEGKENTAVARPTPTMASIDKLKREFLFSAINKIEDIPNSKKNKKYVL